MSYMLDTNACIALIKNPQSRVRRRFGQEMNSGAQIFVSSVSSFELFCGAVKSSRQQHNQVSVSALLSSVDGTLAFDDDDARTAGQIRAALEKAGTPIGPYDLLIAGQAVRRGHTLVTANEREFRRVPGLRWENWA
jgi:tRNA(fMet)-specific endonuclease VapC